jgi:hypothetical protein
MKEEKKENKKTKKRETTPTRTRTVSFASIVLVVFSWL